MGRCPACQAELPDFIFVCSQCGHILTTRRRLRAVSGKDLSQLLGESLNTRVLTLSSSESLDTGAFVELCIVLPGSRGELELMADVGGVVEVPGRTKEPWDLQLRLLDLDARKRKLLEQALAHDGPPPEPATKPSRVHNGPPPIRRPSGSTRPPVAVKPITIPADVGIMINEMLEPWHVEVEPEPDEQPGLDSQAPAVGPMRKRLPEKVARLLTEFTVQLVQAVTASTYYTADHKAAGQAKTGLYTAFTAALEDRPELTYLVRSTAEKRSVMVYGLFDEPAELSQAMLKGMAEMYTNKLSHYFDSRGLFSVSFRKSLDEKEFHRFTDLLAEPVSQQAGVAKRFAAKLAGNRIHSISVVFQEDRVTGRQLSWRVETALTRLKKDLAMLPLYEHLSQEQLRKVRLQVIQDILRPLRQLNLQLELLENCDLVSKSVKELSDQGLAEAELLEAMPRDTFPALLDAMAKNLTRAKKEDAPKAKRLTIIIRRISERLTGKQALAVEAVLRDLHDDGVLKFDELPGFLKTKVVIAGRVDRFLKIRESFHSSFDQAASAADYQGYLDFFQLILPELMRQNHHVAVMRAVTSVAEHRTVEPSFQVRPAMALHWLEQFPDSSMGNELRRQLMGSDKVQRDFAFGLCRVLGPLSNALLFEALLECQVRSTREQLCGFLVERRAETMEALGDELAKKDVPWYYTRNLLLILGRIGGKDAVGELMSFLRHEHPKVRLEALSALQGLDPTRAEDALMFALSDSDPAVRQASMELLVQMGCSDEGFFDFCHGLLKNLPATGDELATATCSLMRHYESGPGHDQAVKLLLGLLQEELDQKKGWSGLMQRGSATEHVEVKVAACQSLGRLKATAATDTLKALSKSKDEELKRAAVWALHHLEEGAEGRGAQPRG